MTPLRALVVEAQPRFAARMTRLLEAGGDIAVIATVVDADAALAELARRPADVVVIDLERLPDAGQDAIESIMSEAPTPILAVCGDYDGQAAPEAIRALAAGAVDAMPGPADWSDVSARELRRQVRRVGGVPVIRRRRRGPRRPPEPFEPSPPARRGAVVAVAASTGGPPALATLLRDLGELPAPILVVQHIHETFAPGFAAWLAGATGRNVTMAVHGEPASGCRVYVAPGGTHLRLGADGRLELTPQPVLLHRPSADVLFHSVAEHAGNRAIGVLLTGMGDDGANGLLAIRRAGGLAVAQDASTSAVFGMPRAAQRLGAAELVLPLAEIAPAVRDAVPGRR